ncbi:MAG TPA: hypothetical protein VKZ53_05120 [Candidatus Angelobacter sp.]|nr:hypothetical protein [Candidatus Angelobacter sp.]
MGPLKSSRTEDCPDSPLPQPAQLDIRPLLGTWVNTNASGWGIAKVIISEEKNGAYIEAFGSGSPALIEWGKRPLSTIYAKDVGSSTAMAFDAQYDLEFMDVRMEGNCNLGLLVLACLNVFKDGSGRSNYFSREFFGRKETV